jgi:hypothetical protein
MAKGNDIVVSRDPRGRYIEGYISGSTVKPGQCVQLKAATEPADDGRYYYELAAPGTDGDIAEMLIVVPDYDQGQTESSTYADGSRIFIYQPLPGDELNVLVLDVAGTADDIAIGTKMILDTGTGKFIATTGTPESEPFVALETITDPTADYLLHVRYTGN